MLTVDDFVKHKFKHLYHNNDLNYDMFSKKALDVKIIFQQGEHEGHFYDIPTTWIIRHNLTIFNGKIENEKELALVLKMVGA